jgi:hypothetical protein
VYRALARTFVDLTVAIVVFAIRTDLGVAGEDIGIGVIAVSAGDAVAIGIAIAVSVAIDVRAGLTFFDAPVDGAGLVVAARRDLTPAAPERWIALLDAVAKEPILTARIVRHVLTTPDGEVAGIERTFDAVIALPVFEARAAERGPAVIDDIEIDGVALGIGGSRIDYKGAICGYARASRKANDDPGRAEAHADRSVPQVPEKAFSCGP